jgi:hypothetical protein
VEGQILYAEGHGIATFKITRIFERRKFATIEAFDVSRQKFTWQPIVNVPSNALNPFKTRADLSELKSVGNWLLNRQTELATHY